MWKTPILGRRWIRIEQGFIAFIDLTGSSYHVLVRDDVQVPATPEPSRWRRSANSLGEAQGWAEAMLGVR